MGVNEMSAPVGCQHVALARKLDAGRAVGISDAIHTVKVESVTIELRAAMCKNHVVPYVCHFIVAVVVSLVAYECEGVTLAHLYVSESLKRV